MSQPTPDYSSTAPVLVTGATGYLAGWIVKRLLEEGKTVHAAVRDPSNKHTIAHLDDMAASLPGDITYFKADLLDDGSFDEAIQGCDVVMHTASPFTSEVTDPQKDLVDPAVRGTRKVLGAANRTDSVKRVVLTSSCAAIYGDNIYFGTLALVSGFFLAILSILNCQIRNLHRCTGGVENRISRIGYCLLYILPDFLLSHSDGRAHHMTHKIL